MFGDSDYLNENFVTTLGQCYAILSAAQPFPDSVGEEWPCDICGDVFGTEEDLENHTAEHYKEICSKSPTRSGSHEWASEHNTYTQVNGTIPPWRTEQFSEQRTLESLPICRESKNDWVSYLMEHEEDDVGELQICAPAPESYESKHNLTPHNDNSRTPPNHIPNHRSSRSAKPKENQDGSTTPKKRRGRPPGSRNKSEKAKCPFDCGATVAFSGLIRHVRLYHTEHLCKCDVCGKLFYRLEDLRAHRDTHKSGGPYICKFCNKPFKRLGHLKEHETSHSRELQMSDTTPAAAESNHNFLQQNGDHLSNSMTAHTSDINQLCMMNPMEHSESNNFKEHQTDKHTEVHQLVPSYMEGESDNYVKPYRDDHITAYSEGTYMGNIKPVTQLESCNINGQESPNSSDIHTLTPALGDNELKLEDGKTLCNCIPICEKPHICSTSPEEKVIICYLSGNEAEHSRELQMSAPTPTDSKCNGVVEPEKVTDIKATPCAPTAEERQMSCTEKGDQTESNHLKGNEAKYRNARELGMSTTAAEESESNKIVTPQKEETNVSSTDTEQHPEELPHREHEAEKFTQCKQCSQSTEGGMNCDATPHKEGGTYGKCDETHMCPTKQEEHPEISHLKKCEAHMCSSKQKEHLEINHFKENEAHACPSKPEEQPKINNIKEHEVQSISEAETVEPTSVLYEIKCVEVSQKENHRTVCTPEPAFEESKVCPTAQEEHPETPRPPQKRKRRMCSEAQKNLGDVGVENPRSYDRVKCPFECGATVRYSGLTRHIRIHTGERPYKCNSCDKTFQRADDLQVHKYKHKGGAPYTCKFCGKGFNWPSHLKGHEPRCSPGVKGVSASFANQHVQTRSSS